jgi:heme/copper-type cytochrome/quinol oxidase subunit 1
LLYSQRMTSLVRRFLKTAILFLAVGLAIGGWMIVDRELTGRFASPYVRSAHTHAILVGFVMMMILGVALWMFPRPVKGDTSYSPRLAVASYWMLASGTAVRIVGELLRVHSDATTLRYVVIGAGFTQIVGLLTFFVNMWSRIRAVGSQAREASGERF